VSSYRRNGQFEEVMAIRKDLYSPDQLLFLKEIDELGRLFHEQPQSASRFARWMLEPVCGPQPFGSHTERFFYAFGARSFQSAVLGFSLSNPSLLSAFVDRDDFMRAELLIIKGNVSGPIDRSTRRPALGNLLCCAASDGNNERVRFLIRSGADIHSFSPRRLKGEAYYRPLICAAAKGHNATVELLLRKGANVSDLDSVGRSPLYCAAMNGHTATVELLLDRGANVSDRDATGRTTLDGAVMNGHTATVQLLLERGANLQGPGDLAPLSLAAANGHTAIVQLLLEKGADIEATRNDGNTPLLTAAYHGKIREHLSRQAAVRVVPH
jgi:hypothetical protein